MVRRHLTDLERATRSRVQTWIEDGRVSINGRVVRRVSTRAALGDTLTVLLPDEQPRAPVLPEDGQLDRLYEDEHLLVANKPAGVVSHPTFLHPSGSLLNVLLWHARDWPADQRPSLVGRLDKHTSGAMVIAKSRDAHARLQRILQSSQSEKSYLAVVYGPVVRERGVIDLPLCRHPDDRRRVIAALSGGLSSLTRFARRDQVERSGCTLALMQCQLLTGRMHQVRVHMAASTWPLVGDPKYGEPRWQHAQDGTLREMLRAFPRQALHAWRLSFTHPFTRQRVEAEAPIPDDMRQLIAACGLTLSA